MGHARCKINRTSVITCGTSHVCELLNWIFAKENIIRVLCPFVATYFVRLSAFPSIIYKGRAFHKRITDLANADK